MDRLARLAYRRPWTVLGMSAVLLVLAAIVGSGAIDQLKGGGFTDPASESTRAEQVLAERFGVRNPNLILLVSVSGQDTVDSPRVVAEGQALMRRLAIEPGVQVLDAYWAPGSQVAGGQVADRQSTEALRSRDLRHALIIGSVAGDPDAARQRATDLGSRYRSTGPVLTVRLGGPVQNDVDFNRQARADLKISESIAIPLTLVLLVVVFGTVVAGMLPVLVGGIAVVGAFATLALIAAVTDVSLYAINLTTALGLGLAVDYSLLIVSRYREELATGRDREAALRRTLNTAGRTVGFSAVIVATGLAALVVFPLYFLRSFAYAGVAVVAVAAAGALVTLPAALVLLGPRIEWLALRRRRTPAGRRSWSRWPSRALRGRTRGTYPAAAPVPVGRARRLPTPRHGLWYWVAAMVMRRPVLSGAPVIALLLFLAVPFLSVRFWIPDDRVLTPATESRQVGDVIRAQFASDATSTLSVVLTGPEAGNTAALRDYAGRLSTLPGVTAVRAATGTYHSGSMVGPPATGRARPDASHLSVAFAADPFSADAEQVVRAMRAAPAPGAAPLVGGTTAVLVDVKHTLAAKLPAAGGIMAVTTLVLLFLFTGSVVLPVKALVVNVLTLSAVLGVLVWIFQYGHGSAVLGFTPTPISVAMPLLTFCVAFGLSMDYEVFLLARIAEQHAAGYGMVAAVAAGLERIGRIVTTAAALLAITFFSLVSSRVSFIQMFGVGTGFAILLDATLVRGVLVPAAMRVLGEVNWWAPRWLRPVHRRWGISEVARSQAQAS